MTSKNSKTRELHHFCGSDVISWRQSRTFVHSDKSGGVVSSTFAFCVVCNKGIREKELEEHPLTKGHLKHLQDGKDRSLVLMRCRDVLALYTPRIDALRDTSRKSELYAWAGYALLKETSTFNPNFEEFLVRHERHELLESRIYLLELAVWKNICTLNPPDAIRSVVGFQRWVTSGWKENKGSFWRCNEILIIMDCVLPFMGMKNSEPCTPVKQELHSVASNKDSSCREESPSAASNKDSAYS